MASIRNRGTKRGRPNWVIEYTDIDGRRKCCPSKQPTKQQAELRAGEIEARIGKGLPGVAPRPVAKTTAPLMDDWLKSTRNRNRDKDAQRIRKHLVPYFGGLPLKSITLPVVLGWLSDLRAGTAATSKTMKAKGRKKPKTKPLSEASIRYLLAELSLFFAWAVDTGIADINPAKMVPRAKRPKGESKSTTPWIDNDADVLLIFRALPEPINFMFYLANRCGLRQGEAAGLRMADVATLDTAIHVRFSFDGPLKEARPGKPRWKWAPSPYDAPAVLGPWIARREAEGAQGDDLLFPADARIKGGPCRGAFIIDNWKRVRATLGPKLAGMTWYQITRHSFVSRCLKGGASMDEVSGAVGHTSVETTRQYYAHFERVDFSPTLRAGLGLDTGPGEIVPLRGLQGARTAKENKA